MDTSYRKRRLIERLETDPEFRAEYRRASREIGQVDAVMREIDARRAEAGCSKAALARLIGKEPAAVRRLFTTDRPNPELSTVCAMASALGFQIRLVPDEEAPAVAVG